MTYSTPNLLVEYRFEREPRTALMIDDPNLTIPKDTYKVIIQILESEGRLSTFFYFRDRTGTGLGMERFPGDVTDLVVEKFGDIGAVLHEEK